MIPAASQNGNVTSNETLPSSTKASTSNLENELKIYREFYSKSRMLIIYNDYNIRSQLRWDTNEMQINNDRQLKGNANAFLIDRMVFDLCFRCCFLFSLMIDFRNTIQSQLQVNLYINCEVETFASYVISGLQLLQFETFQ